MNYNSFNEQQVKDGVQRYGPAPGSKMMIQWEQQHAIEAIQSQQYVTYYCLTKNIECGRVGSNSKCFCGHLYKDHYQRGLSKIMNTSCFKCECKQFKFVPRRPEECGMWWLPRRKDFNVQTWRAPCKCKHTHEQHNVNPPYRCNECAKCFGFDSNFACISCDQKWEDHEVIYESEQERKKSGKPFGEDFMALASNPDIQEMVFNSNKNLRSELEDCKFAKPKMPTKQIISNNYPINHNKMITNESIFPKPQLYNSSQFKDNQFDVQIKSVPKQINNAKQMYPKTISTKIIQKNSQIQQDITKQKEKEKYQ